MWDGKADAIQPTQMSSHPNTSFLEAHRLSVFRKTDCFSLHVLLRLTLAPTLEAPKMEAAAWDGLWATAEPHHVPVRAGMAFKRIKQKIPDAFTVRLDNERARIAAVIERASEICMEMEESGIQVAVIKSLDHWPDFGSDVDLFTDAPESFISAWMRSHFDAETIYPTLSDRLASKVNYRIPGLDELVEVHFGRLGQTGEHVELARRILNRRQMKDFGGVSLPVPATEEQLILATLQRMYRHFYIRICDIVNASSIVESGEVDFDCLQEASRQPGIWPGVATYLGLVSQYVRHYRGTGLSLPSAVSNAVRFGIQKVYPNGGFLRVPMFPQAAALYTHQLAKSLGHDAAASLRLTLLPPLAAAAAVKYRVIGSNEEVW